MLWCATLLVIVSRYFMLYNDFAVVWFGVLLASALLLFFVGLLFCWFAVYLMWFWVVRVLRFLVLWG